MRPPLFDPNDLPMQFGWSPVRFDPPDAPPYSIHWFYLMSPEPLIPSSVQGGIERHDGTQERFTDVDVQLRFDPRNRRLLGGRLVFETESGEECPLDIEVVGPDRLPPRDRPLLRLRRVVPRRLAGRAAHRR